MTTGQAVARRPTTFAGAIEARDLNAIVEALAPDAVLHSAVAGAPFEGREVLADLYASVLEAFDEVRIVDELENGSTYVFFWEGRIHGRFVAGADRLRFDEQGRIREITIVGRPLAGLATFVSGIGAGFARRRRGPLVAFVLRVGARPLAPLFSLLDPVTRWLARGRRSGG